MKTFLRRCAKPDKSKSSVTNAISAAVPTRPRGRAHATYPGRATNVPIVGLDLVSRPHRFDRRTRGPAPPPRKGARQVRPYDNQSATEADVSPPAIVRPWPVRTPADIAPSTNSRPCPKQADESCG